MECRHCHRAIRMEDGVWIDPEATGDDSVWRETCDAHDTFQAEHEPPDDIQGALDMMVESIEVYANEGGTGSEAFEALADMHAFASYALDGMMEQAGIASSDPWIGDPWEGWV